MKEQLLKQIEELKRQVELLDKPEFKTGWYKTTIGSIYYLEKGEKDWLNGYGIGRDYNQWFDKKCICKQYQIERPATDKEVEEALIKEAKKRGFKEGCVANNSKVHGGIYENNKLNRGYSFHFIDGGLYYGNLEFNDSQFCIFKNGKWAKIIKDEPIKIGGYEVVKEQYGFKIGCKKFRTEFIKELQQAMESQSLTKVSFDGIETDLETINKILNL